jgi:beta-galactosidase
MLPLSLSTLFQPDLSALNRLPSRAPLTPFPDAAAAQGNVPSPWRQSLDGKWRFQLVEAPGDALSDWVNGPTTGEAWRPINVPGVWTRQDTWDKPIYCNYQMPFALPSEPGQVPQHSPTGLYRTAFSIPADWAERTLILHIGGFESCALVWLNGVFVGMGKDSRLPSEFDLMPFLSEGENQLAIMVTKWSDATWIEDQDHWRHGGIHRSVWIEARGHTRIDDVCIVADYDAETGVGSLSATLKIEGASFGWKVRGQLLDANGYAVAEMGMEDVAQFPSDGPMLAQLLASYSFAGNEATLACSLVGVQPWTAECPNRYRLVTELVDPQGNVAEAHAHWVGFRRVEVRDRRLLVNGKPIIIIGVNRHDHHEINGKTPSLEDMRADLVSMKRHNINAVRTAHYPNDHRLLNLADELGLYVIGEANVECHARARAVSNDPRYQTAILDRMHRMILRDRNHPCIIGWSLGNESGHGPAHDASAALARRLDPTRFVQYEGAVMDRFVSFWGDPSDSAMHPPGASERATTDIVCPMYPPLDFIMKWARWAEESQQDDRPLIMCEFSHAMGNSNGSIVDYVDAFYAEPALGGGFVWEWRDHGLAETDGQGRFYWAYGGHFGESRHDGNFCCDGLVASDGVPHPGLKEYMWAARPIVAQWLGDARVRVINRRIFSAVDDLECGWSVQKDGKTVESGTISITLDAGAVAITTIPFETKLDGQSEWHLTLEWRLKAATAWADAGHLVAWDQLEIERRKPALPSLAIPPVTANVSASEEIRLGSATISFNDQGNISGVGLNGNQAIEGDITACLWRAPVDNDGVKTMESIGLPNRRMEWIALGLDHLRKGPVIRGGDGQTLLLERAWEGVGGHKAIHRSRWTTVDDSVQIEEEIFIPETWTDMPRVGIRFTVPAGHERFEWLGLGPDESYPDRCGAQMLGNWQSTVEDQYHPYALPQEHGAHQQTRSFSLKRADGKGLSISLPVPLSVSARHHFDEDLDRARTLADLVRRDSIEVHIDAAMRGVGTGACGPDALPAYRAGSGYYRFSWILKAI